MRGNRFLVAGKATRDNQTAWHEQGASVLLFGPDPLINSIFPQHEMYTLLRIHNTDRNGDQDMVETNLIESYDRHMDFGKRRLNDPFVLDGDFDPTHFFKSCRHGSKGESPTYYTGALATRLALMRGRQH